MILLKLFAEFFKTSCFTFGGAYGAIPLIRDMVLGNGWLTEERLSYMIAVSESTPGPIIVNMATYIGSSQAGFWGALVATVAVVLPAYLIIVLVMGLLRHFLDDPRVRSVLTGLSACVSGIILATGFYLVVTNLELGSGDFRPAILTAITLALMGIYKKVTEKKLSPIGLMPLPQ